MSTPAIEAATTYFDAWKAEDFDRLRSVLADDVTFTGPINRAGWPPPGPTPPWHRP
jgi:ketosteroid isomerase-like protein